MTSASTVGTPWLSAVFFFEAETLAPQEFAAALGERAITTALPFTEAMGLEPGGTLRIGLLHYNTEREIDQLLAALAGLV